MLGVSGLQNLNLAGNQFGQQGHVTGKIPASLTPWQHHLIRRRFEYLAVGSYYSRLSGMIIRSYWLQSHFDGPLHIKVVFCEVIAITVKNHLEALDRVRMSVLIGSGEDFRHRMVGKDFCTLRAR